MGPQASPNRLTPPPPRLQLRVYRVWSFQTILERSSSLPFFWIIITRNILLVLTVTHIFACIFFFITYYSYYAAFETRDDVFEDPEEYEEQSWFGIEPQDFRDNWSTGERYLRSLYWSMTTFTTVGYGDFSPQTHWEQGFVTVRGAASASPRACASCPARREAASSSGAWLCSELTLARAALPQGC